MSHQAPLLEPLPPLARSLRFELRIGMDPSAVLETLAESPLEDLLVGLGGSLLASAGVTVDGLREHPAYSAPCGAIPSSPSALWLWLGGNDRGDLVRRTLDWQERLPGLNLVDTLELFTHRESRDLSGYIDGTENPVGAEAVECALVAGAGAGLDGSSFVAVQRWQHDLKRLWSFPQAEQDHIIGRRLADNEELEDAPASAHVKRSAQESFSPEAFVLRRSMPWADRRGEGLLFIAAARSFSPYEAILSRMAGREDGIADALFRFTRPMDGSYFWCPPTNQDRLDLRALG